MSVYEGLTEEMQPNPVASNQEDKKMGKGLLRSKTVWFNLLSGAVSIITYLSASELFTDNPGLVAIGGTIVAVMNIILRMITKEPITSLK